MKKNTKIITRIVGIALILSGITLAMIGFSDLFTHDFNDDGVSLFFCSFIGLPCIPIGAFITALSFREAMHARAISSSAKMFKTMSQVTNLENAPTLCVCGQICPEDAAFCVRCGASLIVKCDHCGKENKPNYDFCMSCGKPLKK